MTSTELRRDLVQFAIRYADSKDLGPYTKRKSAILFDDMSHNFHPASFEEIKRVPSWRKRTLKPHQKATGYLEMESSNSSDALLMSVFCHPRASSWRGLRRLLGVRSIRPRFGLKAGVLLTNGKRDETEIDMALEDLLVEAKLTETDFTQKGVSAVQRYTGLTQHFHSGSLARTTRGYDNYQVIRNLLAAIQLGKRHVLLCDARRPDLVRRYLNTVSCLQDVRARDRCGVIFWQEVMSVSGRDLRDFMRDKYGMCQPMV
jgi:hypothetical protein